MTPELTGVCNASILGTMPSSRALIIAFVSSGCATGVPLGARPALNEGYEPFAQTAPARTIPAVPVEVAQEVPAPPTRVLHSRALTVTAAEQLVGQRRVVLGGRRYGDDCTGLVRGVYAQLGIDLMSAGLSGDNGVTAIYRFANQHGRIYEGGRPVPGDLVFFRDTYDVNRDGRVNDGLTHIGLVNRVEEDGTVLVIHRVARGVVRYRMNLAFPNQATSPDGRPVNDWLRAPMAGATPQLTAQLFAGYATLLPNESQRTESSGNSPALP